MIVAPQIGLNRKVRVQNGRINFFFGSLSVVLQSVKSDCVPTVSVCAFKLQLKFLAFACERAVPDCVTYE